MASSPPVAETEKEKELEAHFSRLLKEKTAELDEFVDISKETEIELQEHIEGVSAEFPSTSTALSVIFYSPLSSYLYFSVA